MLSQKTNTNYNPYHASVWRIHAHVLVRLTSSSVQKLPIFRAYHKHVVVTPAHIIAIKSTSVPICVCAECIRFPGVQNSPNLPLLEAEIVVCVVPSHNEIQHSLVLNACGDPHSYTLAPYLRPYQKWTRNITYICICSFDEGRLGKMATGMTMPGAVHSHPVKNSMHTYIVS